MQKNERSKNRECQNKKKIAANYELLRDILKNSELKRERKK
jgi:hypothetical protein